MSYLAINTKTKSTALIELSLSSSQTSNQGDIVVFDTLRSAGSHNVSVDASGNISLDTSRSYWIQASIDVDRSSLTSSWAFSWYSGSTQLTPADGAYSATWEYHTSSGTQLGYPNATFTATYVSSSPASSINLKADVLAGSSSINTSTKVIIVEVVQS